ncbi:DUF5681 domain-containing protein [Haliea sp. E17]|uniref:DUF5681 domain-containing protein n=1 Tax=Haliea sp. E17 TaxID=3401576 RepID=UPI003AAD3B7D
MPFEKGQSGNPEGRPKGITDRRMRVRDLLEPSAPELAAKAVEMALQGDSVMLKACLDKLIPNARATADSPVFEGKSLAEQGRSVIALVSGGHLPVESARAVMGLLEQQARLEEHGDLEERIAALEEAKNVA